MSQFDKNQFIERMPLLQHLENQQVCWNDLELGVREFAKQSDEAPETRLKPFQSWWKSAFDLFATRQLKIVQVNYEPSEAGDEEFIELCNQGPAILDLSHWRINAGDNKREQNFVFPERTLALSGQVFRIYTQAKDGELSFGSQQNIWNNKGDSALLFEGQGRLIATWSYGNDAKNHISITRINFDGEEKGSEGDEFIEITNTGSHWLDISGWKVESQKQQSFQFPANSSVAPYQAIRVYTNQVHPETGGYSFASKTAIWNNKGDVGVLLDHRGTKVSELSY